jgi:hypothetical protein
MKRRSQDRGKRKLKMRNQNQRLPSTQIPEVLSLFPSPPPPKLISCFSHPCHTRSYSLARYLSQRLSAASVCPESAPRTRMGWMCGRRMVGTSPNKPSKKWISSDPTASTHILHRAQHQLHTAPHSITQHHTAPHSTTQHCIAPTGIHYSLGMLCPVLIVAPSSFGSARVAASRTSCRRSPESTRRAYCPLSLASHLFIIPTPPIRSFGSIPPPPPPSPSPFPPPYLG